MIKDLKPGLFETGKIKIGLPGAETKSGNDKKFRQPRKLDHFTIVQNKRDENGDYIADSIMQKLDEKPTELDIMLISDDIDVAFQTSYALYAGKTCKCRGDGETAERYNKDGTVTQVECSRECEYRKNNKCKPAGTLNCLLRNADSLGGCYKFRTHGYHSVKYILSSLWFIKQLTGGVLAWIPLKLKLNDKLVEVKVKGNAVTQKIYYVTVEYPGEAQKLIEEAMRVRKDQLERRIDMQKLEQQTKLLLNYDDDAEEIVNEFYPENRNLRVPDKVVKTGKGKKTLDDKLAENAQDATENDLAAEDDPTINSTNSNASNGNRINAVLDAFGSVGLTEMDIQRVMGVAIDDLTPKQFTKLECDAAKLANGIKLKEWGM